MAAGSVAYPNVNTRRLKTETVAEDSWREVLSAVWLYLNLRRRKGLLGYPFLARALALATQYTLGPHRTHTRSPLIATIAITSRCPLNCYHCSALVYKDAYELPADVIRRTLDEFVALGCPTIALTGGEPLVRRELLEFLDRIPPSVLAMLYTSGMGLTDRLAGALARRRNLWVSFSLDHSDPHEHDRRRGLDGSHAAAMRGIERLSNGRAEILVSTVVTRDRLASGELIEFARAMKQRGVSYLQLFEPLPVGRLTHELDLYLGPEEEEQVFKLAQDLNRDPDAPLVLAYPVIEHPAMLGCVSGYARVHVDTQGHVCPCDFTPLSFGRVTEESLTSIWERMRGFFASPGSRSLVRDHAEVFGPKRETRNVLFSRLPNPHGFHASPPGLFTRLGETVYRLMVCSPTLATVAACRWNDERPHDVRDRAHRVWNSIQPTRNGGP